MRMKVEGFEELTKLLDNLEISEKRKNQALNEAGEIIKGAIEGYIAVKTGYSKNHVRKKMKRAKSGSRYCLVEIDDFYYRFQEYGTSQQKKNVGRIHRAVETVQEDAIEKATEILLGGTGI